MLTLSEWLERYLSERDCSKGHRDGLRLVVKWFGLFLGHPATLADLTDENVNRWLTAMIDKGLSRRTVRGRRVMLLGLWRAAFAAGQTEIRDLRVKKINVPRTLPQAWDERQVSALLAACAKIAGAFKRSGISRAATLRAAIMVFWYAGLRLGDLMRLEWENIGSDGTLVIVQHKTGWPVIAKLPPEAMSALDVLRGDGRRYVFRQIVSRKRLTHYFAAAVRAAELKGGTKTIRKSGATAIEKAHPGSAMGYLGHLTPGLAFKHYIDARHLAADKPTPPRLTG